MKLFVGINYFFYIRISEFVLVFSCLKTLACIYDKYVRVIFFSTVKHKYCSRNSRSEKEICRQSNHCLEKIFFYHLLSDFSFTCSSKQYSVRHNNSYFSSSFVGSFYHMRDECPVSFAFWWYSSSESIILVSCRIFSSSFVQAERGVRNYGIEFHQRVSLFQFWII